ncbi:hypothetical protein LJR015_001862 [Peribacillus frigoritolerans]
MFRHFIREFARLLVSLHVLLVSLGILLVSLRALLVSLFINNS